jgi:hypothetical protein
MKRGWRENERREKSMRGPLRRFSMSSLKWKRRNESEMRR